MNMLQNIFAHLNLNQYVCAAIWRLAFRSGRILVWCSSGDQEEEEEEEATAKKNRTRKRFAHFDLQMCFAPQRRAIFHLSSGQLAPHPAALASLLFDPPEPQIIGKTQCFATFVPFLASASSFFLLFLFYSSFF